MRLFFLTFIVGFLVAGCGDKNHSDAKTKDGVVIVADSHFNDASMADGNVEQEAMSANSQLNSKADYEFVNQIDVVRPKEIVRIESEVFKPDFPRPSAGQTIKISAGSFLRGSAPQDVLRDQFAENDNIKTKITPFEIDVLPYPNNSQKPFLTGVSYKDASLFCAKEGKRLCTEIEWEYACRSGDNRRYPFGNIYNDSPYLNSIGASSPFGVFGMGKILEWTQSKWGKNSDQVGRYAVKGFALNQLLAEKVVTPQKGRRCAKRWHRQPETSGDNLGFRCCKGPENKEECFLEPPRPAHSLYKTMKPEKFIKVIQSIPELYMIHDNPHMFSDADIRAILARRTTNRKDLARQGIHFIWKPMRWIPRQGTELWVAVGRSARHSFVVALHEIADNEEYVHASSVVLWNQPMPLALAFREGHRDQIYWAPCWGCRDGGIIEFDDEKNEAIITYKW